MFTMGYVQIYIWVFLLTQIQIQDEHRNMDTCKNVEYIGKGATKSEITTTKMDIN